MGDDEHTECAQALIDFDKAVIHQNVTEMITIEQDAWEKICNSHFGEAKLDEKDRNRIGDNERHKSTAVMVLG